jgi:hypothetical protein
MKLSFFFISSFLSGVLAACGGSTTSGGASAGSISGPVAGTTLTIASGMAVLDADTVSPTCALQESGGETCGQQVTVLLTNRADATCASEASNSNYANLRALVIGVSMTSGGVVPGTYAISENTSVARSFALFLTTTSTCTDGLASVAATGSVTVSDFSATNVTGTYNVSFGTEGTVSGSFDVPICAFDAGTTTTNPTPVCQP